MTAVQSGKIDKDKLRKVSDKVSKLPPEEVNSLLDLIDKNLK
jgi:Ca2+-binding EF-hand superfamily protein